MPEVLYVVTERSAVGDTVLGVFSSLERARRIVPPLSSGRLDDYRIEGRVLDQPPEPRKPWRIVLTREGSVQDAEVAVVCACDQDEQILARSSYIAAGGEHMQVVVRAESRGQAIAAAQKYREWLLDQRHWTDQASRLESIEAAGIGV